MASERVFKIALLFSLGIHSILFVPSLGLFNARVEKDSHIIEVTYLKIEEEKTASEPILPLPDKKLTLEDVKNLAQAKNIKPKAEEPKAAVTAKNPESTLAEADPPNIMEYAAPLQKGSSDALNYLRAVRSRINNFVRANYSASMGEGEASVHFVVNNDGTIHSIAILKDNLANNKKLRELCADSILLSSPFKPFPEALDLPQASFNISISFKRS